MSFLKVAIKLSIKVKSAAKKICLFFVCVFQAFDCVFKKPSSEHAIL